MNQSLLQRYSINPEKLFQFLEFTPHGGQKALYDPDPRFKVYICGRRWGKSLGAARWAEPSILVPGTRGWVVSKTYDLTRKVIREIQEDLVVKLMRPMGLTLTVNQQSGPIVMEFPWGSTVEGKSALCLSRIRTQIRIPHRPADICSAESRLGEQL